MKLATVQHLAEESPGAIVDWAERQGVDHVVFRADQGQLPNCDKFDGVILLGGPESVTDPKPPAWLADEKDWVNQALKRQQPLFGVCLGAQMLAQAMGSSIRSLGTEQAGWKAVSLSTRFHSGTVEVLQWHHECFELPPDATAIASSDYWPAQGFSRGSVMGVQFHAEWTPAIVQALRDRFGDACPLSQPVMAEANRFAAMHRVLFHLLDQWWSRRGSMLDMIHSLD